MYKAIAKLSEANIKELTTVSEDVKKLDTLLADFRDTGNVLLLTAINGIIGRIHYKLYQFSEKNKDLVLDAIANYEITQDNK